MYCVGLPPKTQTSANVEAPASSGFGARGNQRLGAPGSGLWRMKIVQLKQASRADHRSVSDPLPVRVSPPENARINPHLSRKSIAYLPRRSRP